MKVNTKGDTTTAVQQQLSYSTTVQFHAVFELDILAYSTGFGKTDLMGSEVKI